MATVTIYISSSAGVDVFGFTVSLAGLNLSYELPGVADGEAADWTNWQVGGEEEVAEFSNLPWEDFEQGFSSNELSQDLFALTDLQLALFELATQPYEGFNHSWFNNQFSQLLFDIGDLDAADFSGDPAEDFEDSWSNNELSQDAFGGGDLDPAMFDTGAVPYEDFENAWYGNNNSTAFPTVTFVNYDVGVPESVEDFEEEWTSDLGV